MMPHTHGLSPSSAWLSLRGETPRGSLRRLLPLLGQALLLAWLIAGCGGSGSGEPVDPEDVTDGATDIGECAADADCAGGEVCREGRCRFFCRSADDCPEDTPFCDEELRACGACLADADCGAGATCERGQCVAGPSDSSEPSPTGCEPGTRRCDGTGALLVCAPDGDREIRIRCEEGTACAGPGTPECREMVCEPNEEGCDSGTVAWRCDQTGTAVDTVTCDPGTRCSDGRCRPVACDPEDRMCDDDLHFICADDGQWVEVNDCVASADCVEHPAGCACTPEDGCVLRTCAPDARRCVGDDIQTCDADGVAWLEPSPCPAEEACRAGACVPLACTAGDRQCAGDTLLTCAGDGGGWEESDCTATGQLCRNEVCVDRTCNPGERRCNGALLQRCNSTGDAWRAPEVCPGAEECRGGACVTVVCTDGERRCDGQVLETCAPDNTEWLRQDCAASNRLCRNEACVEPACTPGATRCDGDVLLTCNAAGDDETTRDCSADQRQCEAGSGGQPARCGACAPGTREQAGSCVLLLVAPTSLTATTTITEHVRLTWSAVQGATGYHVYRNDARITQSPVTATAYNDAQAPAPPQPGAPGSPTASSNRTDGVMVSWSTVTPQPGPGQTYTVRAVDADLFEGLPSNQATGRRAAATIERYEVEIGGAWTTAESDIEHLDTQAPLASLAVGAPTATPVNNTIRLSVDDAEVVAAPQRSYRVRAVSSAGTGPATSAVSGRRTTGTLTYTWSWSATGSAPWTQLASGTSTTAIDTTIPADTIRHYRVQVSADGATTATSATVQGRLPKSLGATCEADVECGPLAWCPSGSDTVHRRCAPRPAPGGHAMPFVYIPSGQFLMGSPPEEAGRLDLDAREDQRAVTITRPFFLADAPVTQGQWRAIAINSPSLWPSCGDTCALDRAAWWSAVWYANRLSEEEGLEPCYVIPETGCTGNGQLGNLNCGQDMPATTSTNLLDCEGYRLPTEAEWEYAVRAGTTTATWLGNLTGNPAACEIDPVLDPIAWYCANSGPAGSRRPMPVRGKDPNPWGLYDMLGNMTEWTTSYYILNPGSGPFVDPTFTATGSNRTLRSGSYGDSPRFNRAALRMNSFYMTGDSNIGFRLARTLQP